MATTCDEVARLVMASGRATLAGRPELQDHIGTCETCADLLISFEEAGGPAAEPASSPPPSAGAAVDAQAAAPPFLPPALPPPLPTPPVKPAAEASLPSIASLTVSASSPPAPSAPAAPVMPAMPVMPPATSVTPPVQPPAFAPVAPTWMPPVETQPWEKAARVMATGRRLSMKIRPVHLWLGSLVSAMLGAVVVLLVVVFVSRREVEKPPLPEQPALAPVAQEPELAGLPASQDDADTSGKDGARRAGTKWKAKGKAGSGELEMAEVAEGIKTNLPKIGPCIEAARKGGEIPAGKHTMIFDFDILPGGAVKHGVLTGPDYLLKTSLPKCLASKLRTWRFPDSAHGASVTNVPVGVTAN